MKNFNKTIILILSINFLLSLYAVFLLSRCDSITSTYDCLWSKEGLFSDIYYQYNTLKYTGVHGVFPSIGIPNDVNGGFDGASVYGKDTRIIYHSPIYYYLAGFFYILAKSININDLLVLHVFSTVIFFFTNILFYFFIKKVSKYFSNDNRRFIIYALALFIFLPTPLHMGIAVQSDGLFHLSIIASFLVYLHFIENKTLKNALYLGLVVGLSLLTSTGGLVVLLALLFYVLKLCIKKEYKERNLISLSFIVSSILGAIPFVRTYILTGCIYGDMHSLSRGLQLNDSLLRLVHKLYDGFSAFWAGIEGGLPSLKPPLIFVGVLLILLTLAGLIIYIKESRKKIDLDFIVLTYIFTVVCLVLFICNPFMFLRTGLCYGREIQNRFMFPLASMFPLFATIALIKLQNKKPYLKYFIYSFIILSCLVFITDFISALV